MDRGTQFLPQGFEVEFALSAGPEHLRADATVYVFGKRGYEKVKVGSNGFTCLVNRDGFQAGDRTLSPTCWDAEGGGSIAPVMLRVGVYAGYSGRTHTGDIIVLATEGKEHIH